MKLLLVSLNFNVPGFGCPGSPALMLMGGGARIYFCALCPLGGISGRNTSDSDGCELSGTAQAPGCLVPVLETCSSEGEGKGFPLLVLEYHRESRDCFSFDLSVDVAWLVLEGSSALPLLQGDEVGFRLESREKLRSLQGGGGL